MTVTMVGFEFLLDARKAADDLRGREVLKVLGWRSQLTAGHERQIFERPVFMVTHLGT